MGYSLTSDFRSAGQQYTEDTKYLQSLVKTIEGQTFLDSIPLYRPQDWGGHAENNCTSFAFNVQALIRLQPGYLGTGIAKKTSERPVLLEGYTEDIRQSLEADGLPFLGKDMRSCVGQGVPAALFFLYDEESGDRDYHWFAMRRTFNRVNEKYDTLIWADKRGLKVSCCDPSIFARAKLYGYNHFAGYYAVPQKILGTP